MNRSIEKKQKGEGAAFDPKPFLRHLTHRPGTYEMINKKGSVIYVGKARDLRRRVGSYFSGRAKDAKTMALTKLVTDIQVTVTRTETEALILENNLIKKYKPRFNVLLRDDKSYPYIHVTTDNDFPRLTSYRGSSKKTGQLFGPYPSVGSVREGLNQLQKLFRVRQCDDSYFSNRNRPCLQYQIQRCTAPCVGLITKEEYQRDVAHAMLFLRGQNQAVTDALVKRMEQASQRQAFERAAQYRDQLAELKRIEEHQLAARTKGDFDVVGLVDYEGIHCLSVMFFRAGRLLGSRNHFPRVSRDANEEEIMRAFLMQYYTTQKSPKEILISHSISEIEIIQAALSERTGYRILIKHRVRGDRARWVRMAVTNAKNGAVMSYRSSATFAKQLKELGNKLGLSLAPSRLECFDVSHTGGTSTVASCVVFGDEGPIKSDYRRFNISGVEPGDDYGALRQALKRRYRRVKSGEMVIPDILFIDGGRGQLSSAVTVLDKLQIANICLVGVAKGPARRPGHERLYLAGQQAPTYLAQNSAALHLIQQIRDEAHRFAVGGHRMRRGKNQIASRLEEIPGLGPKRRRVLLQQ
ncbi:MAG: excinuclease ABC subunit UvrC, partial [Pseudomonadota bacterium]|nr:excinuclease ABC subunit UvrC [Pseudomonadota bacterium]